MHSTLLYLKKCKQILECLEHSESEKRESLKWREYDISKKTPFY